MFGLRQQIGGDPIGIVVAIGHHQDLGRTGNHVDTHRAEHLALGGRHIGIAGSDDLIDGPHRVRTIRECADRLRAPHAPDLIDTRQTRSGQHQRIEHAFGRGHGHGQAIHAGHARRNGVHQHG